MKSLCRQHMITIGVLVLAMFLSGCAGYAIVKNGTGKGYDVYRPEPYLMVTPGEKGSKGEIVWLPNYNERYRIHTWNVLAKADFQFDIADGWQLTKISDKSDNTAIAAKLMDVVEKGTQAGTIALTGETQLYRLVYTNGVISGMQYIPRQAKQKKEETKKA